MKTLLFLSLAACLYVATVFSQDIPSAESILADHARLYSFLECVGGEKESCEPWTSKVTDVIPTALKTGCADCTEDQKNFIRTITLYLKNNEPDKYQGLVDVLDKDHSADKGLFSKFLQATD